ncbi:serine/threonine-protein kinase PLK4 [Leptidea sinapis]|uniref:serine/threonine-protein kinase PLK4 n=1 Tax=Leptidea sinapis TaxID=189913 RepID=UPI00213440FB|nr:serine/threonine-protein kinase PLK4 [Leptidea sinapis]XP_050667183.1 serine/threonine-protein kinase PLK4 [Leptidea sinapis]
MKIMFGEKIEDYEILEHLGKGGFAHVYRAKCRQTGLFVAIKMIDKALMVNAGMIGRVRQEVTIHSRLKHPAILELYTFFEDAHYVYLVLELAHNGELAKHFKLGTRGLSEKAASDIFRQVVSGVVYLHTHNIIHRDLSLNNLLLTKDLRVKIADFGLATQLNGPDEKHVTMCGTPNYISPEVASREHHGLPADVWGLGCMLYTLLVGSPPFHTQHVKTTLNRVINADYKIPLELSIQAQDLLQRLLCKDPSQRITLKSILEHPFLTNMNHESVTNIKQDLSKDSGFLTTLHSTQHSNKLMYSKKSNPDLQYEYNKHNLQHDHFVHKDRNDVGQVFNAMRLDNNCGTSNSGSFKLFDNYNQISTPILYQLENLSQPLANNIPDTVRMTSNSNCPEALKIKSFNTESNTKPSAINSQSIGVPPLCADRLPSISHRTRNAILKIDCSGVIVEFIKRKGREREEKIVEICKISKDGMKILITATDKSLGNNNENNPNVDEVFTYHNLPQKHWKKYLYAARFVDLVKAKTPKITLYSSMAKCQLMENGTDIEMFFYSGEKITSSASEGIKIIDKSLKTYHSLTEAQELKYLSDHFEDCANKMKRIQGALSCISDECYPLIIGKRPIPVQSSLENIITQSVSKKGPTPHFQYGSFHRGTPCSSHTPSDK